MNTRFSKVMIVLQIAFTVLAAGFILFHITDNLFVKRAADFNADFYEIVNWTLITEDGREEQITLPANVDVNMGDTVRIKAVLPDNVKDGHFLTFYNSRDFCAYVGDEIRYSFTTDEADVWGGICARRWFFIPLYASDAGKTVTVHRCNPAALNNAFFNMYYGDSYGITKGYGGLHRIYYYCAILLAAVAFAVMLIGTVMHAIFRHKIAIIEMSVGMLMAALWLVFEAPSFQLIFNDYYVNGALSYMAVLLMPYPIICYINDIQKRRNVNQCTVMMAVSLAVGCVLFGMHLTGIRNFEDNFIIIIGLQTVLIIGAIYIIMKDVVQGHLPEYSIIATGSLIFLFLAAIELILVVCMQGRVDRTFLLTGLYTLTFSGLLQQIIEIRDSEREKQAAIEANIQKSSFLANMSHEIRTPINSIIGMNEIILRENTNPEITDYARQIDSSGRLLLGLINDVLDFSKIEAGKLDLMPTTFSTAEFANDIIVMAAERAKHKNIDISFNISDKLPTTLIGDDLHIKQIIINLVSNAVKYTNEGTVTFSMNAMPSFVDASVYDVKFTIKDTGIGIKKENIGKLFDSFTRVDEKKNRSIEGTGLGLSIVKKLVDAMNGVVKVESEYGKGSTFTVVLPLKAADRTPIGVFSEAVSHTGEKTEHYIESFHAPKAKILVVDDNAVNLKVVKELLKNTKIQLDMAGGGLEAVKKCEEKHYDLILMDHRMPEPDGIASLHLIRTDKKSMNSETPVIVLTANAFAGLKEKYMEEGFADYLTKPIDSKLLEDTVKIYLPGELVDTEFASAAEKPEDKESDGGMKTEEKHVLPEDTDKKGGRKMNFADSMRTVEGMDYDATSAQYGGGEEFMRSLLETVVMDGREKIEMMYKYLEEKDYEDYGIEAHAAKSTMATINAADISAHAKKHEFAAKENNIAFILEDSKAFLEEYADILNRIEAAMNNAD